MGCSSPSSACERAGSSTRRQRLPTRRMASLSTVHWSAYQSRASRPRSMISLLLETRACRDHCLRQSARCRRSASSRTTASRPGDARRTTCRAGRDNVSSSRCSGAGRTLISGRVSPRIVYAASRGRGGPFQAGLHLGEHSQTRRSLVAYRFVGDERAERPGCSADMIAYVWSVLPATPVVHQVVHADRPPVPGMEQERQRRSENAAIGPVTAIP